MRKILRIIYLIFFSLFFAVKGDETVPVLLYHSISKNESSLSVDPDVFEQQMQYLYHNKYQTVLPFDMLNKKFNGKNKVLITFDDGFRDNLLTALPILKKYGFIATIFISAAYIGGRSQYCRSKSDQNFEMMNIDEIRRVEAAGWCVANHFLSHRNLTGLCREEIQEEYDEAKNILSGIVDNSDCLRVVAYPRNKFNKFVRDVMVDVGVEIAFGGDNKLVTDKSDLLNLPRISVRQDMELWEFKLKLKYGTGRTLGWCNS